MTDPVKFTFKKKSEKPILRGSIPEDETEYITNTSSITQKPTKKAKLSIPHQGNLWQPGGNVDKLTKEAITQILNPSDSVEKDSLKAIESSKTVSSLKFPGIVPQKEASAEDYDDVPVTAFGEALMRGMGWEKGGGVGRKRQIVEPIDFDSKKKTLGVTVYEEESAEANRLFHEFRLGDYIEIVGGQDKGTHAKILSLSLETSRCIVRLPSEEVIDLALINISKGSHDQYLRQRDLHNDNDVDVFNDPLQPSKRLKTEKKQCSSKTSAFISKVSSLVEPWLHQDLKVRIVCQKYLGGIYYCKKVDVVDIIDSEFCICRDEYGKLLDKVPQSILETVIPKEKGALVLLLSGQYRFQIAELEEKNSKSESIICITSIDKDVITVPFGEVCQYIGDLI